MKHKAHIYFWIAMALILLVGGIEDLVFVDDTLAINLHDTYYVVDHWDVTIALAIMYFILGIVYRLFDKAEIPLQKKLTKVHTVITVLVVPAYYILWVFSKYVINDPLDVITGKNDEFFNKGLIMLLLAALIVQPLFLINIVISLVKRKKHNPV